MTPNYEASATRAMELLLDSGITHTPIDPLPILKNYPRVRILSFTKMANEAGIERKDLIPLFGHNQDAATFKIEMDDIDYVVVYNQRLPVEFVSRALARELGHIALGHDGVTRTSAIRMAEAKCFAQHLLCPRPLIYAVQQAGIPLTVEVVGNVTGCFEECLDSMRKTPGVHISPELNRQIKNQFADVISDYICFQKASPRQDHSRMADFGHFMDGYEE